MAPTIATGAVTAPAVEVMSRASNPAVKVTFRDAAMQAAIPATISGVCSDGSMSRAMAAPTPTPMATEGKMGPPRNPAPRASPYTMSRPTVARSTAVNDVAPMSSGIPPSPSNSTVSIDSPEKWVMTIPTVPIRIAATNSVGTGRRCATRHVCQPMARASSVSTAATTAATIAKAMLSHGRRSRGGSPATESVWVPRPLKPPSPVMTR